MIKLMGRRPFALGVVRTFGLGVSGLAPIFSLNPANPQGTSSRSPGTVYAWDGTKFAAHTDPNVPVNIGSSGGGIDSPSVTIEGVRFYPYYPEWKEGIEARAGERFWLNKTDGTNKIVHITVPHTLPTMLLADASKYTEIANYVPELGLWRDVRIVQHNVSPASGVWLQGTSVVIGETWPSLLEGKANLEVRRYDTDANEDTSFDNQGATGQTFVSGDILTAHFVLEVHADDWADVQSIEFTAGADGRAGIIYTPSTGAVAIDNQSGENCTKYQIRHLASNIVEVYIQFAARTTSSTNWQQYVVITTAATKQVRAATHVKEGYLGQQFSQPAGDKATRPGSSKVVLGTWDDQWVAEGCDENVAALIGVHEPNPLTESLPTRADGKVFGTEAVGQIVYFLPGSQTQYISRNSTSTESISLIVNDWTKPSALRYTNNSATGLFELDAAQPLEDKLTDDKLTYTPRGASPNELAIDSSATSSGARKVIGNIRYLTYWNDDSVVPDEVFDNAFGNSRYDIPPPHYYLLDITNPGITVNNRAPGNCYGWDGEKFALFSDNTEPVLVGIPPTGSIKSPVRVVEGATIYPFYPEYRVGEVLSVGDIRWLRMKDGSTKIVTITNAHTAVDHYEADPANYTVGADYTPKLGILCEPETVQLVPGPVSGIGNTTVGTLIDTGRVTPSIVEGYPAVPITTDGGTGNLSNIWRYFLSGNGIATGDIVTTHVIIRWIRDTQPIVGQETSIILSDVGGNGVWCKVDVDFPNQSSTFSVSHPTENCTYSLVWLDSTTVEVFMSCVCDATSRAGNEVRTSIQYAWSNPYRELAVLAVNTYVGRHHAQVVPEQATRPADTPMTVGDTEELWTDKGSRVESTFLLGQYEPNAYDTNGSDRKAMGMRVSSDENLVYTQEGGPIQNTRVTCAASGVVTAVSFNTTSEQHNPFTARVDLNARTGESNLSAAVDTGRTLTDTNASYTGSSTETSPFWLNASPSSLGIYRFMAIWNRSGVITDAEFVEYFGTGNFEA